MLPLEIHDRYIWIAEGFKEGRVPTLSTLLYHYNFCTLCSPFFSQASLLFLKHKQWHLLVLTVLLN